MALSISKPCQERGDEPSQRIEQIYIDREKAKWAPHECREICHCKKEPPAQKIAKHAIKNEIVKRVR